jgi:TadE-like protein
MRLKRLYHEQKKKEKGQSFIELTIVLVVLLMILSGMTEFGLLLNQYITLVDAARSGARLGSNGDPFLRTYDAITCPSAPTTFCIDSTFFTNISDNVVGALEPLTLDPSKDDIIISFFSVRGSGPYVLRFPNGTFYSKYGNHVSAFSDSDIVAKLTAGTPSTGILLVEVFYSYNQILKSPFFTPIIPDPIPVHTYAIMPLSAAEPTPTPIP